jgi:hypothetical protein
VKSKFQKIVEVSVKHSNLTRKYSNQTNPSKPNRNPEQPSPKKTHKPKINLRHPKPEPTKAEIKSKLEIQRTSHNYREKKKRNEKKSNGGSGAKCAGEARGVNELSYS